ncbi:UDP-N-acetylmuramoyl-L-alanine--D-glutamate ligase [Vibrio sonorensis]|uniref:UDP-N-acetylmuramoyl-L-alanine--D-glutamate ligase n=1 Tax=Vibrio sonorensis TaxID=1004316 RepID=UPI0008D92038|nr:UDP-N-acetylmuramoyl-L-alanine--D-glutamate ligase [Vibrio sonorensis]
MSKWQSIDKVVVVGLGITGLSVLEHLKRVDKPLDVRVIDTRETPPGADKVPADVETHFGSWNLDWLLNADLVVANPGIALATAEIQQTLNKGIPVVGDIELFAWQVNKPVIAITGSNGKSTVTDLMGVAANAAGVNAAIGGNIGVPALDLLKEDRDLYILELSSFQLETTSSLELVCAAFLNLSEDHMDRYIGMDDYRQAKLRIFDHAKHCVVNADDRATYPESSQHLLTEFSLSGDTEFGIERVGGNDQLIHNGETIVVSSELALVGQHNVANVLVVLALLHNAGIDYHKALGAIKSYSGLTHRCQVVADRKGVKWVNDSKATNVASTLAALSGLSLSGQLYLLVGGVGKGADFSDLAPVLEPLAIQLCCFGADGNEFLSLHPSAKRFDTMEEIVEWLSPKLVEGDMVMLSPACASFDQFSNFMARGEAFTQLAKQYA